MTSSEQAQPSHAASDANPDTRQLRPLVKKKPSSPPLGAVRDYFYVQLEQDRSTDNLYR